MSRLHSITILLFCFGLLLCSCRDNKIDPFEKETGIYSVYGAMDLHSSTNVIRVKDLNIFFGDSDSVNLDAKATFFDLTNNTSQVLKDSVVQFPANYTHNFMLYKDLEPNHPYRVDVERSDGLSVSSMFTTPPVTETEVTPANISTCYTPMKLVFKNVLPDEQIRIEVTVSYEGALHTIEFTNICITEYFEEKKELVITTKPYLLLDFFWPKPKFDPPPNCRDPRYPTVLCSDLDSTTFTITYEHLGPEWKRVFPARASDPDDVGDVENGIGFLGAFREDTLRFTVNLD